jgi:hypothetical protein
LRDCNNNCAQSRAAIYQIKRARHSLSCRRQLPPCHPPVALLLRPLCGGPPCIVLLSCSPLRVAALCFRALPTYAGGSRGRATSIRTEQRINTQRRSKVANDPAKKNGARELMSFQPYILRHTALTQLVRTGYDAFTLARIAGHSSITITQRYIHPQADAIERAFAPLAAPPATSSGAQKSEQVGTNLGTGSEGAELETLQVIGAKGGTRTPTGFPARS